MHELMGSARSQKAFLDWMRARQPALYRAAISDENTMGDIADSIGKVFSSVVNNIDKLATVYVTTTEAKKLIELNAKRAKQGLLPVDSLTAGMSSTAVATEEPGMPGWLIPAAIGLLALVLLRR